MKRTATALIAATLLLLGGCSDLSKDEVVNEAIESERFNAGCELKISEFEDILKRNIAPQIDCLGRSLDLFLRVVESGRPGYLSRRAFEQYVRLNVPDFKPENIRAIKAVFDVSHLLFGEDPEYLSPQSVRKIIDFLFLFNEEVIKIYPFFTHDGETPYGVHESWRERVFVAAESITTRLHAIYVPNRGSQVHRLNIVRLLEAFSTDETEDVLNKIKSALFVKKLLVGGEAEVITHLELHTLLPKLSPISKVAFDLYRFRHLTLNQKTQLDLLHFDLEILEEQLFQGEPAMRMFSIDELTEALANIVDPETLPDLRPYREDVLQLKMTLTSSSRWSENEDLSGKEWVTRGELTTLINRAKEVSDRGRTYHRIYEFFQEQLASPAPVSINFQTYANNFPTHQRFLEEFARIVTSYRFYKGPEEAPYYTPAYRRNADGVVEIGILEYLTFLAFQRYGEPVRGAVYGVGATQAQLLNMIMVFNKFLVGEGLITAGREVQTNENIVLLTTLFQFQSNGDGHMTPNEVSEFATTVMTSMPNAKWFEEELARVCPTDQLGRISDLSCYRREYFGLYCRKFRAFFPQMFAYLGMTSCGDAGRAADNVEYLKKVEKVARTCTVFNDNTDVPVDDSDFMPIQVVLMNIEGVISRFDANNNNQLDPSEVRRAYDATFKSAIEAMVKERAAVIADLPFDLGDVIAQRIYYYLLRYRSVPDSLSEYMRLITIRTPSATRDTIAAVLKVIGDQGEPDTFDCETLRHRRSVVTH